MLNLGYTLHSFQRDLRGEDGTRLDELCTSILNEVGEGGRTRSVRGDHGSLKQNGTGCLRTGHLVSLVQHISISRMLHILMVFSSAPPQHFFSFKFVVISGSQSDWPSKAQHSSSEHAKSPGCSVLSAAAQSRRPSLAFVPARSPRTTGPYYRPQSGPVNIFSLGHAHQRRNAPERICCSVRHLRSHSNSGEEV